ncbi:Galactosylceramide sulfotransferase [Holothuria leucospilota]|uniref:Galactosylceramide sulfotransferase n=1 Tax=Holothuria leucospilota TaxID=206669 RepID=A0A9Q1BYG7_HOLLE|nr:Galactosylceramide sulfotransferase [Holothuria leucospilota]
MKKKIREIENNFNIVLIVEHFDESLVLLKDLLAFCWEIIDVAYFTVNARIENEVEELSQETKGNLTAWNEGDMMLYNHFNKTL